MTKTRKSETQAPETQTEPVEASQVPAAPQARMTMKEIDLTEPLEQLLRTIESESDLYVLSQAAAKEKSAGRRSHVMGALETRAMSLRTHGDGSEGPDYDLPGYKVKSVEKPMFSLKDATQPQDLKTHDYGDGADAKQNLTQEQRLLGELKVAASERRMNTKEELFTVIEKKPNGTLVFPWGHIMMPQKEIKDEATGKVLVRFRASTIFLKACPRCGRVNRPAQGALGKCFFCDFDFVPYVKTEVQENPGKFPGVVLA